MCISEELDTEQTDMQHTGITHGNTCVCNVNIKGIQLYTCTVPFLNFYQWNDFVLRVLRLLIEQKSSDTLKGTYDNPSTSTHSTALQSSSCASSATTEVLSQDFLLLKFIRFLQLIQFIPWSSPIPIADSPIELSKKINKSGPFRDVSKCTKRKQTYQKPSNKPGLCGLNNIGNTCFMNSAIQCLSNIPQLTEWANKQQTSKDEKTVTQAYISLIQSMWSGHNSCITPLLIKQRVSQHAPIFCDYAQKDSHEFMNSLLNALQSEFEENNPSENQSSIVTDLFRIRTDSGVTCLKCGTYDPIEETTYCLPLPLGDEPSVSLNTLFNDFTKEEQLDGQYYCSNCQELREAKQKTSICLPLPPVIIVQLKRFTFDETNDKLDTFVDYPILDWKVNDILYDLVAVSLHVGNLKRGHYTTYARLNGTDRWYHFNDSEYVLIEDINCILTRNAYVLVYLQKNN